MTGESARERDQPRIVAAFRRHAGDHEQRRPRIGRQRRDRRPGRRASPAAASRLRSTRGRVGRAGGSLDAEPRAIRSAARASSRRRRPLQPTPPVPAGVSPPSPSVDETSCAGAWRPMICCSGDPDRVGEVIGGIVRLKIAPQPADLDAADRAVVRIKAFVAAQHGDSKVGCPQPAATARQYLIDHIVELPAATGAGVAQRGRTQSGRTVPSIVGRRVHIDRPLQYRHHRSLDRQAQAAGTNMPGRSDEAETTSLGSGAPSRATFRYTTY